MKLVFIKGKIAKRNPPKVRGQKIGIGIYELER